MRIAHLEILSGKCYAMQLHRYILSWKNTILYACFCSVEEGTKPSNEPKFVVFYNVLVAIFQLFCFHCKWDKPAAEVRRIGTMASVTQKCKHCGGEYTWKSQPSMFGRHPAGNVMLSFGILTSGAKISQTLLVLKHMGLSAISPRTYYYHQKKFLFPSILKHWGTVQSTLLQKVKEVQEPQWSGDGRFDSMGHSAKYGVYTMYCNSTSKLVHFELLQVHQYMHLTLFIPKYVYFTLHCLVLEVHI